MVYMETDDPHRIQGLAGQTLYPPATLRALTDEALLTRIQTLSRDERATTADIVEHLSELDRREAVLDRAYPTLYEYCVKKLGYSESAAYFRVRAAQAANTFPEIIQKLRAGRLHLEAIVRIQPHLTAENSNDLLSRVDGASKRDVMCLVASMQSQPPPDRDVITPVRPSRAPDSAQVVPATSNRFHFTGDAELFQIIAKLRSLLRHKYPDGRLEDIFKDAGRHLLETLERRHAPSKRHRPSNSGLIPREQRHGSRIVPRRIKREVWSRDGGRCSFRAEDGTLCGSREALEYDHILAWADGGRSDTAENVRLLCRAHNQRLGRQRFGPRRRM